MLIDDGVENAQRSRFKISRLRAMRRGRRLVPPPPLFIPPLLPSPLHPLPPTFSSLPQPPLPPTFSLSPLSNLPPFTHPNHQNKPQLTPPPTDNLPPIRRQPPTHRLTPPSHRRRSKTSRERAVHTRQGSHMSVARTPMGWAGLRVVWLAVSEVCLDEWMGAVQSSVPAGKLRPTFPLWSGEVRNASLRK